MKFKLDYYDVFYIGIKSNTSDNLLLYIPKIYLERGKFEICTNYGIRLFLTYNRAIRVTGLKVYYSATKRHNIRRFKSIFNITVLPSYLNAVKENIKL